MNQFIVTINGKKLSYWKNNVKSPRKTLFILPYGPHSGKIIKNYMPYFDKDVRIISPDYPGRGKSDPIEDNSAAGLAASMNALVKKLKLREVIVVGISFGFSIANEMVRLNEKICKTVVFVAGGEYFSTPQRIFLNLLFYPAKMSEGARRFYRRALISLDITPFYPPKNLKSILGQWLDSVNYLIPEDRKISTLAVILNMRRDKIVRKKSLAKLERIFTNCRVVEIDASHSPALNETDLKKIYGYINGC